MTREAWIDAERRAGFSPKGGGDGPATGGFGTGLVEGRILDSFTRRDAYADDPEFSAAVWPGPG